MSDVQVSSKRVSGVCTVAGWALMALAAASAASASAMDRNWYATGTFGFVTQTDQRLSYTRPEVAGVTSQRLPLDTGFLAGGSIGRYVGDAWRKRAFVDAGLRYLLVSGVELDGEQGAVGRVKADYEPLALIMSFGWRF